MEKTERGRKSGISTVRIESFCAVIEGWEAQVKESKPNWVHEVTDGLM
jgi:hypothetical protein